MAKQKLGSNLFSQQARSRKEEQQEIEKTIATGKKKGRGRPVKDTEPTITVTVRMTAARRQKLKEYAVRHQRTVSDVLSAFVDSLDMED